MILSMTGRTRLPRIAPYTIDQQVLIAGYVYFCPGCGHDHFVRLRDWTFNGSLEKPTFRPSVLLKYEENGKEMVCHSFVQNGKIIYLDDCTHGLKGKIVEMDEIKEEQYNFKEDI
jgi:hypothetical protein